MSSFHSFYVYQACAEILFNYFWFFSQFQCGLKLISNGEFCRCFFFSKKKYMFAYFRSMMYVSSFTRIVHAFGFRIGGVLALSNHTSAERKKYIFTFLRSLFVFVKFHRNCSCSSLNLGDDKKNFRGNFPLKPFLPREEENTFSVIL